MSWTCSHYGRVSDLFFRIPAEAVPMDRLQTLALHLATVGRPSRLAAPEKAQRDPIPGIHDELAQQEAYNWGDAVQSQQLEVRFDRDAWSIDIPVYAAFVQAFHEQARRGIDLSNPVVGICHFLSESAIFNYDYRERYAVRLLLDGLRALEAGKLPGQA